MSGREPPADEPVDEQAEKSPDEPEWADEATDNQSQKEPSTDGWLDDTTDSVDDIFTEESPAADSAPDDAFDEMGVDELDGEALWEELARTETAVSSADVGSEQSTDSPNSARSGSTGSRADTKSPPSTDSRPKTETETGTGTRTETGTENPTNTASEQADSEHQIGGDSPMGIGSQSDRTQADTGKESVVDKRKYCQQCPYFTEPPAVACTHEGTKIIEVLEDGQFRLSNCPVVTDAGPDRTILNDEH